MSYFTAQLDNKRELEKTQMTEEKKRINPRFSGKTHSSEAKQRISATQQARYEAMRKLIRKGMQQPIDEARVKQICKEAIDDYFKDNNLIEVKNNKKPMNINL